MRKIILHFFVAGVFLFSSLRPALACDSCGCALARISSDGKLKSDAKPFFFDFTFEQQVWHARDSRHAHELHHEGHHAHNKTHEEFYHFSLGANAGERISFLAELPYIVRHSTEIDSHAHLGERQRSEGFGDMRLTAIVKALKKGEAFIGPVVGIKLPTGSTTDRNNQGEKFEAELQPGSGSIDPIMGAAYSAHVGRWGVNGNALYTIRTQGAQDFRFGNLFSTYLYVDYVLNPESRFFKTRLGVDTLLQHERKQHDRGTVLNDSGGVTWFLGPEFSVQGNDHVSVFGNILFPVYQNLGGVHQLVQFVWNAGVKISF